MTKAICAITAALALCGSAGAATFSVTRIDDPAPDGCVPGDCSLREAVIDADQTVAEDTLELPSGTYLINLIGNDNSENTGDLDITTDMVIRGTDAIIDGQSLGRIMDIRNDAGVTLEGLTLTNANTSLATNGALNGGALQINGGSLKIDSVVFALNATQTLGGAIYAFGGATVLIENSAFIENTAGSGAAINASTSVTVRNTLMIDNVANISGGAAYLSDPLADYVLERVSLIGNSASGSGGGAILFLGRSLTIDGMVATGNSVPGGGGGVVAATGTGHPKTVSIATAIFQSNTADNGGVISYANDQDVVDISHSSFVDNTATGQAGAIFLTSGTVNVTNATFSGNQAAEDGGAIRNFGGRLNLRHVTIAGPGAAMGSALSIIGSSGTGTAVSLANSVIDGDCFINSAETVSSSGGNLESPGDTCGLDQSTDLASRSAAQLGLQPLRGNSGATPTHDLTAASQARGNGETAVCSAVAVDQLHRSRSSACSAGAVESNTLFRNSFETAQPLGSDVTVPL